MSSALPSLPRLMPPTTSAEPTKEIFVEEDLSAWANSDAYGRITLMAARLNAAVTSYIAEDAHQSDVRSLLPFCHIQRGPRLQMTRHLVDLLAHIDTWIDEIPLHQDTQRFGNRAFRDWGARLEERAQALHEVIIPHSHASILPELVGQFTGSFGSFVRIDYGSGHELAFLAYLTGLHLVGLLEEQDEQASVTVIFARYLRVCHRLQAVYNLEPAGSKGVWGLVRTPFPSQTRTSLTLAQDDHQFLSYLFGSSQLIDHPTLTPRSILTPSPSTDLFLLSVAHIRNLKRGPFAEHSPLLDNIARTVPNWRKVNSGLMKMWRDDVLGKQPVVQHFRFGPLLPWTRDGEALPRSRAAGRVESEEGGEGTKAPWAMATGVQNATKAPWAR